MGDTQASIGVPAQKQEDPLTRREFRVSVNPRVKPAKLAADLFQYELFGIEITLEYLLDRERDVGEDCFLLGIPETFDAGYVARNNCNCVFDERLFEHRNDDRCPGRTKKRKNTERH